MKRSPKETRDNIYAVFPLGKKERKAVQASAEGAKSVMEVRVRPIASLHKVLCGMRFV